MLREHGYLTATDVKHFTWCEAIIYVKYFLGIQEESTEYMELGREVEKEKVLAPLIPKYKVKEVVREPTLRSERFKVVGTPDYVLITKHRERIPVEIKWAEPLKGGKPKWDHVMQLATYAVIMDEGVGSSVKRGVLYYLRPEGKLVEVRIDYSLKELAVKTIGRIRRVAEGKEEPRLRSTRRCPSCNYVRYCPYRR